MQSNKKRRPRLSFSCAIPPPPDNELIRFSTRLLPLRMDESDSTSRDCCAISARYAIITTRPCRPFFFNNNPDRFTHHNILAGNGVNLCVYCRRFQINSAQSESIAGRHWSGWKRRCRATRIERSSGARDLTKFPMAERRQTELISFPYIPLLVAVVVNHSSREYKSQ